MQIEGARVLLTGASGGLGAAIARDLHERGATLAISGRRADALEALAAELGERVEVLVADLADREAVAALPERAGRVDVLVANAALPASGELESFEPEQIDRALDVNLRAPIQLTRALAPAMRGRGFGHLVYISSISGRVGAAGGSIYSATKFGLRGLAVSVADELGGHGVGATVVYPGFIRDAGLFHDSGAKLPPGVGTRRPGHVARAVRRGIERGKLEITVAPLPVRATAAIAGVAHAPVSAVQRRLGGHDVAADIARGQVDKR